MTPQHIGHLTDPRDAKQWQDWLRSELGERMAEVIWRRYGMGQGAKPLETNVSISKALGVSTSRIHQNEFKALRMLRHPKRRVRVCALPHGGALFNRIADAFEICAPQTLAHCAEKYP